MSGCFLRSARSWIVSLLVLFLLNFTVFVYRHGGLPLGGLLPAAVENVSVDDTLDFKARTAVQTVTAWKAPIIWELMFQGELFDRQHIQQRSRVAVTVFAVGKYLDTYLHTFLTSAEKHLLPGLRVTYFVFTDLPEEVRYVPLAPQRYLKVVQVEKHGRWQDVSMMRMKTISDAIESQLRHDFDYVFCFDVDQEFTGRFGSEVLGESVALLHAHYYKLSKLMFTYDRNPKSRAYMRTGDFYYHAAIFGGSWRSVKRLVDACYQGIMEDKRNGVEALWHDESHLNRYFWEHKPSRLLSPEYCWDRSIPDNRDILVTRLVWAPKHYGRLRENKRDAGAKKGGGAPPV